MGGIGFQRFQPVIFNATGLKSIPRGVTLTTGWQF